MRRWATELVGQAGWRMRSPANSGLRAILAMLHHVRTPVIECLPTKTAEEKSSPITFWMSPMLAGFSLVPVTLPWPWYTRAAGVGRAREGGQMSRFRQRHETVVQIATCLPLKAACIEPAANAGTQTAVAGAASP